MQQLCSNACMRKIMHSLHSITLNIKSMCLCMLQRTSETGHQVLLHSCKNDFRSAEVGIDLQYVKIPLEKASIAFLPWLIHFCV